MGEVKSMCYVFDLQFLFKQVKRLVIVETERSYNWKPKGRGGKSG